MGKTVRIDIMEVFYIVRILKRIWCVVLCVCICSTLLFQPREVYAKKTDDYKTFSQGDPRWGGKQVHGCSYNIATAGCFITAIAVLMAYANPELRDVEKFNPGILSDKLYFQGNGLDSTSVSNADPTFTKVADDDAGYTGEAATKKILEYINKGYYVTIMCGPPIAAGSTHFSPIVGVKDGKPVVMDVNGQKHPNFEDWANATIQQIDVFKSTKNSFKDVMEGGTGNVNGGDSSSTEPATDEANAKAKTMQVKEEDLVGMIDLSTLKDDQKAVTLPDNGSLSLEEKQAVSAIKISMEGYKWNLSSWFGKITSFLGLVLVFYSVLLFVGMLLDYVNVFIEFSLLEKLTFGRYRLVSKDYFETNPIVGYDKYSGRTNLTCKMCICRLLLVLAVGLLLLSGVLQEYIVELIVNIKNRS